MFDDLNATDQTQGIIIISILQHETRSDKRVSEWQLSYFWTEHEKQVYRRDWNSGLSELCEYYYVQLISFPISEYQALVDVALKCMHWRKCLKSIFFFSFCCSMLILHCKCRTAGLYHVAVNATINLWHTSRKRKFNLVKSRENIQKYRKMSVWLKVEDNLLSKYDYAIGIDSSIGLRCRITHVLRKKTFPK